MPIGDFDTILRSAIFDITENGNDPDRLKVWLERLRKAALDSFLPSSMMRQRLAQAYRAIARKLLDRGEALRRHPGADRFTIENIRPQVRDEIERRIENNVDLIVLKRDEEMEKMLNRFAGWASSIPRDGSRITDRRKVQENVRKSLAGLSFRERRLMIDQGQKLTSAVHDIIATDGGAIAAHWISHWHQRNYDYREDHKERMQQSARRPYVIRDNWAMERGLMRLAGSIYTDDITQPGEEPFCQCYYEYIYKLSDLPTDMITAKGREVIQAARGNA